MIISILQPGYLPWLGFFDILQKSDTFVVLDDVQYTVRDWRSRNRIKTPDGILWLTVPVKSRGSREKVIKDITIDNVQDWQKKHLKTIETFYKKAPYYAEILDLVRNIFLKQYIYLIDTDMSFIVSVCDYLSIKTPIVFSSEIGSTGKKGDKLLNLCKKLNATQYLSGDAAKDYLNESHFAAERITVKWHRYKHPFYHQLWLKQQGFISHLSIIDLLFNHGKNSLAILSGDITIPNSDNIPVMNANELTKG